MKNNRRFLAISVLSLAVAGLMNAQEQETMGDLRAVLDAQKGKSVIDIPKGTYLLDLTNNIGPYAFSNLKDVTVNGNGSTIICNYQKQAFSIDHCENFTIKDLIIDYDPPCSTQGTVVSMTGDAKTLEIEMHEGYPLPDPETEQDRVHFFDPETMELIWNLYSNQITEPIEYLSDRRIRVKLAMPKPNTYGVGDYIVLNNIPNTYVGHMIISNYCKNLTFSNVTAYDSPQFFFGEHYCENSHYYRCVIDRRRNDPKYPIDQLRAGIADGIHSKHATIGPTIEECTIQYITDDPVAINGNFYPVCEVDKDYQQIYILARDYNLTDVTIKADENIVAVSNSGVRRGEAKPSRVRLSTAPTTAEINECLSYYNDIKDRRYINKVVVRFSDEEWKKIGDVQPGDVLFSTNRIGAGFKVINNTIGHVPGRGILIKSSNGKIQNNNISYTGAGAIIIAPEFNWMEAGLSTDLEISGNTIQTCFWKQNHNRSQCAAISVVLEASNGDLGPAGGFKNISIHRNTIKDVPKPCVFLNGIDGGYFYKNTIEPATWERDHGASFLISNKKEYVTKNVANIITDEDPLGIDFPKVDEVNEEAVLIDSSGRVSLKGYDGQKIEMEVYKISGELVSEESFTTSSATSVNALKPGAYILHLLCGGETFSRKYIVD